MKSLFVCLCIASLAFGGCKSKKDTLQLEGFKWILKTLNGKEVTSTPSGTEIFFYFNAAENRVNGRVACNRFFGHYKIDGENLKFSPLGATKMACPNDSEWEMEFFTALDATENFKWEDGMLVFGNKEKTLATFVGIPSDGEEE